MPAVRAGSLFLFLTFPDHLAASKAKVSSEGMVFPIQVSLLKVLVGSRLNSCLLKSESLFPRVLVPLNSVCCRCFGTPQISLLTVPQSCFRNWEQLVCHDDSGILCWNGLSENQLLNGKMDYF